jgi:hypothetical protein
LTRSQGMREISGICMAECGTEANPGKQEY